MEDTLKNLLESALDETGASLQRSTAEVAAYAAQRTAVLSTILGLPGYELAVIAERDNVVLFSGLQAVDQAEEVRAQLIGIIQGALFMAAGLINPA